MDCSLFYEKFTKPKTEINEIPIDKLNILIDKMVVIIEKLKTDKPLTFNMNPVEKFIDDASNTIYNILK